jgi:light-harvesting complex 1 alpha chain
MWRLWQTFNPQRILSALAIFLFTLAVLIHFILLSTNRYNWLDGAEPVAAPTAAVTASATEPA